MVAKRRPTPRAKTYGLSCRNGCRVHRVRVVFEDASENQLNRLHGLLKADIELRRYTARFLVDECMLRRQFEMLGRLVDFHQPVGEEQLDHRGKREAAMLDNIVQRAFGTQKPSWRQPAPWAVALAASVLFLLGVAALWSGNHSDREVAAEKPASELKQEVGLLLRGQIVNWRNKSDFERAQSFRVGDVISAKDGVTNLRFNCGAEVLLKGPAELQVLSPMRASLRRGTLTARVHESAHGLWRGRYSNGYGFGA